MCKTLRFWGGFFKIIFLACLFQAACLSSQLSHAAQLFTDRQIEELHSLSLQPQADQFTEDLLEWALLVNNQHEDVTAAMAFLRRHPHWPLQQRVRETIERNISKDHPAALIIDWFGRFPAVTGRGLLLHLRALSNAGQEAALSSVLQKSWPDQNMTFVEQTVILTHFNHLIPRNLHEKRLNYLLHTAQTHEALEVAIFLGLGYPELARARLALQADKNQVNQLINQIPPHLLEDPGLKYERLRWRRARGLNEGMKELLAAAPTVEEMYQPAAWWRERHILTRRLIEEQAFEEAYKIVSAHRQKQGFSYLQAEWLSGFLTLRFLDRPSQALVHFQHLYNAATTAISLARGAYWSGRAYEALNMPDKARQWYQSAAQYQHTFYGQKAKLRLGEDLQLRQPQIASWPLHPSHRDLLKAFEILYQKNIRYPSDLFISKLIMLNKDHPEILAYLARWTARNGYTSQSVRIAKIMAQKNILLWQQGYPLLPELVETSGANRLDPALTHALIRQESLFQQAAISPAGAMGYMQLMPDTAAQMARRLGVAHEKEWLLGRPSHNLMLGEAYFKEKLERFNGELPVSLAAYNAGQGRVGRWLEEDIGDPRSEELLSEDWIELIPIYETRNYVQRIIEAKQIYRLRLK